MLENAYQKRLIEKLEKLFPGCLILKNDSSYLPGVPDLTIFYKNRWAMLEVKASADAPLQPNQDWYVDWAARESFGAFIYPSNEREVLGALRVALQGV